MLAAVSIAKGKPGRPAGRPTGRPGGRSGIATVWLLMVLPLLLVLLCFVVNVGLIWWARAELESALESAALAAVKHWGDGGTIADARDVGVAYAAANCVRNTPVLLDPNLDPAPGPGNPNANLSCDGDLVFGSLVGDDFLAGVPPDCAATPPRPHAVRAHALVNVPVFCTSIFGFKDYCVQATVVAAYDCHSGIPRLVRIDEFICP